MGRLIDADELKKDLTRFYDGEVVARRLIDEQPTVDAEPVRYGRWIRGDYWSQGVGMGESYGYYYSCSKCGNLVRGGYDECGKNYCDKCGAKNGW